MHIKVLSPDASILDTTSPEASLHTAAGIIGLLDHHAPLMGVLVPGVLRYRCEDGWREIPIRSGTFEVFDNRLLLLLEG